MISILTDINGQKAMYETSTEIFFGPLFGVDEDPQDFLDWLQNHGYRYYYMKDIDNNIMGRLVTGWRKEVKGRYERRTN